MARLSLRVNILLKGYCKRYNIKSVIIRPSAVYGPATDNNYRVVQKFIEDILDKKKLSLIIQNQIT